MRRIASAVGPLQHPERRHLPLADPGRCGSPGRRSSRPTPPGAASGSTRSDRQASCSARRGPRRDHPPRRAVRRPAAAHPPLARRPTSADYYGAGRSLLLEAEHGERHRRRSHRGDVRVCDLSDDPAAPGTWAHEPQSGDTQVAIDPVLGRVAFPAPPAAGETRLATLPLRLGARRRRRWLRPRRRARRGRTTVVPPRRREPSARCSPRSPAAERSRSATAAATRRRRRSPPRRPVAGAADRALVLRSANRIRPLLSRSRPAQARRWSPTPPSCSTGSCSPARRS